MNLLHTRFIRELAAVVIGTFFFVANCAFIFIPAALGGIPGQELARHSILPETTLAAPELVVDAPLQQAAVPAPEPGRS